MKYMWLFSLYHLSKWNTKTIVVICWDQQNYTCACTGSIVKSDLGLYLWFHCTCAGAIGNSMGATCCICIIQKMSNILGDEIHVTVQHKFLRNEIQDYCSYMWKKNNCTCTLYCKIIGFTFGMACAGAIGNSMGATAASANPEKNRSLI